MILEFYTGQYCSVCKEIKPFILEVAQRYGVEVIEVDREKNAELHKAQSIVFLPTIILLDGRVGGAFWRSDSKSQILNDLEKVIKGFILPSHNTVVLAELTLWGLGFLALSKLFKKRV
jgi:thiol-disulfide isomerase/thioredoxin